MSKRLRWSLGLAPLLMLAGVALLGLPGAFIFELTMAVVGSLFGFSSADLPADAAWPLALYLSLLWPLGLPLAALLAGRGRGALWRYALVLLSWCTAASLGLFALARAA